MGLNITRANGQLPRTVPSEDNVICFVFSGAAVGGGAALGTPYQIFDTDGMDALGITLVNNPVAYRDIMDFYGIAGQGAELNFMLVVDTTQLATICDSAQNIGKKVIDSTEGRAVIFIVNVKKPVDYVQVLLTGLDTDVWSAATNLNAMAVAYQAANMPFVGILPGLGFTAGGLGNLPARSTRTTENVAISLACEKNDGHISLGILAGRLAKFQCHKNIGDVANKKVVDTAFYPDASTALSLKNSAAAITAKGFIQFVKVGSKSGYYFNDDPTLTPVEGDYTSISWNRVINKAHRIAYDTLVEKLNGDVDVDATTGKAETSVLSDWESNVENAVRLQMMKVSKAKVKEIDGIKCTIDPDSDIVNDEIDGTIQIVRKGQAKNISMTIGYTVSI